MFTNKPFTWKEVIRHKIMNEPLYIYTHIYKDVCMHAYMHFHMHVVVIHVYKQTIVIVETSYL